MIIDLTFASGCLRIRTRSTPAVRHAVDLVRAVLALSWDGSIIVRQSKRMPPIEFDSHCSSRDAIEELLRWGTHFETEEGLALLARRVRRDAKLPIRRRRQLIRRIAPTLAISAVAHEC